MIPLPHFAGQHVAVLGLGKSGRAAVAALRASGAKVVVWDDKASDDDVLPLTHYAQWDWPNLAAVVMSPGIPLTHPEPHPAVVMAMQHNLRLTCDISLLMEACPAATYIGITGTNGKSTTTALIAHCLRELGADMQCGGNIGVPALSMQPLPLGGAYVLELSSYQLDLMDTGVLNIACLSNISPDHLDRHGSMAGYIAAKERIFAGQSASDVAIIAVDDENTQAIAARHPGAIKVAVTPQQECAYYMEDTWLVDAHSGEVEARADLALAAQLTGVHNHQNALLAYAACHGLDYDGEAIYEAMTRFPGLAHRMEQVAQRDCVRWINDSKATNAEAAARSLATYDRIYWILGGRAKAGGIASLAPYFDRVAEAYCIGECAETFAATLGEHGVARRLSGTLEQAVADAHEAARGQEGAVVLLAPAAASFDQFASFEARGDTFKALVTALVSSR